MKRLSLTLAAISIASFAIAPAGAQEVRIARQFSMGYLQFNVMEHEKLLEKHAAALGLKDVKIVWTIFNGPDAMNNALISDSVDIVAGGVPGLLTLWNRTRGTANEVKGIAVTNQGRNRQDRLHIDARQDGRGNDYYWIAYVRMRGLPPPDGSDISALADNRIAVTPLRLDMTDEPFMTKLVELFD